VPDEAVKGVFTEIVVGFVKLLGRIRSILREVLSAKVFILIKHGLCKPIEIGGAAFGIVGSNPGDLDLHWLGVYGLPNVLAFLNPCDLLSKFTTEFGEIDGAWIQYHHAYAIR
jgi:hypothetical protein